MQEGDGYDDCILTFIPMDTYLFCVSIFQDEMFDNQGEKNFLILYCAKLIIKFLFNPTDLFWQALYDLPVSCHCTNLTTSFLFKNFSSPAFHVTVKCIPHKVRSLPLKCSIWSFFILTFALSLVKTFEV